MDTSSLTATFGCWATLPASLKSFACSNALRGRLSQANGHWWIGKVSPTFLIISLDERSSSTINLPIAADVRLGDGR